MSVITATSVGGRRRLSRLRRTNGESQHRFGIASRFGAWLGFWLIATLLSSADPVQAEGSRDLYPASYPTTSFRSAMDLRTATGQRFMGVISAQQFLYVYAEAGEYILVGSRNRSGTNGGDVRIYNPQAFGTRADETRPGTAAFSCSTAQASAPAGSYSGTGRGIIDTRAKELAGPNSADNSVTLANGFSPCAYKAPTAGIYGVQFTGATSGGGNAPDGSVATPQLLTNQVSAWDVTVRANATSTTDLAGRLFTYAWVGYTGSNPRPVSYTLNYVTSDGYRYRQVMRGIDPNAAAMYANSAGFLDTGAPLYKDVRGASDTVSATSFPAGVTPQQPEYPLFFSDVAPTGPNASEVAKTLGALGIALVPPTPQLSNATFIGNVSGNQSTVSSGGLFQFDTVNTQTYEIVVSRNGTDFDPANPLNRVLTGLALTGTHSVLWDGRDNSGNPFPQGTYDFRIAGRNGEIHFPMLDIEGNGTGGPTLTKLNGTGGSVVYYDDRGYRTRGGTLVGALNGNLCGAASPVVPPTPDHSLLGVDSSVLTAGKYYRNWPGTANDGGNCAGSASTAFGNYKGLDLWALERTPTIDNPVVIVPASTVTDIGTLIAVSNSVYPGDTVYGNIVYSHAGAAGTANATNVVYTAVIGTPGNCPTGVAFTLLPTGVNFTYNNATCAVTFTGMPTTLAPGDTLSFNFQYTAPNSGPVPVRTTIDSPQDPLATSPNVTQPVANAAQAQTDIIVADMATTVTVPATAGPGSTVAGSVVFGNLGSATSTADGLIYSLVIGTPGSCPADVAFPSLPPGVTATFNPATCAVSFSGMPASLPVGQNVTIDFTYTAPAGGTVPVQAGVTTTTPEVTTTNNQDNGATVIVAQADLSITKTDGVTVLVPGSSVTYTITASNAGPSAVTGATVADTLPAALSGATWTCVGAGGGTCTASGSGNINDTVNLPVGASATYTLTATVSASASGSLSNTATITPPAGLTDPTPGNNSATDTDTLTPQADMAATIDLPPSANAGDPVHGTFACTNNGPSPAANATCAATGLPPGTLVNCTPTPPVASLPMGSSIQCTIDFTAPGSGPVNGTATAGSDTPDPVPANNVANDSLAIVPQADLSITKTDGVTVLVPGSSVTYTITASNAGPSAVTGATVADTLPAALSGATWTCVGAGGGTCTASGSGNINDTVNLPVGASATYTLTATVSASASGSLSNTATITPPAGLTDPTPGNNSATDTDTLTPKADLSITKLANPAGTYLPGQALNYTITVTNNGPSDATGVSVTDTVPASVTVSSWSCVASTGADCDTTLPGTGASGAANAIALNNVALPHGTSLTISVNGTASLSATGPIVNTATVTPPAGLDCSTAPCTHTATATNTNGGQTQLTIQKSATPSAFAVGQNGTYSLLVSNTGSTSSAGAIAVSDPLPAGITTTATPSGTGWNCSASTSTTIACTTSAVLTPGANAPIITAPVAIAAGTASPARNTADVSGGGDSTCPGAAHCSSTIDTPVNAPLIAVSKTLQGSLIVGVPTTYTITATNNGQADTLAGTITDTIPTGLLIGTLPVECSASGQLVTCGLPAGIAPGGSVSFIIPITPQASANGQNVSNTASGNGGGDPSCPGASHCSDTVTGTVTAPQLQLVKSATPTLFVVGQPATYTLTLTNTGTAATTAVTTITDVLPTGLTIGTMPTGCTVSGQQVTCTVAAGLATGVPVSFAIPVVPTAALNGQSVTNNAGASGGGDPGCIAGTPTADLPARCRDAVTTTVGAPQLTVVKTASANSFVVGVPASYTLTVTNTGAATTTSAATITDLVPDGLAIGTLPAGCSATGQQVECLVPSGLPSGGTLSFLIPVTPNLLAVPSVSNTATVIGGGDPSCPTDAHCTSTVVTPVNAPALTIVKSASSTNFVVGVPASYTLTVTNTGSAATTVAATVSDNVPSALTLGTMPADCSASGQVVTCTIAAGLAAGASTSFTIPVTPTAAANGSSLTNTATVIGGGDPTCPGAVHCSSEIITPVNAPSLELVKTASATTFVVGVPASYTLTVTNTGSAATTAVATISDTMPAALTLGAMPADCTASGQQVTCTIAAGFAPGASTGFAIPVTPTAAANGTSLTNTATVIGGGDPSCPAAAHCTSTVVTPTDAPALTIVKTASASTFVVGVPASYTLTVTNTGSAATTAVATVSDTMPAALTLGTMPADCAVSGQVVTCTIAAGFAAGSSVSFTIPVTPTAAANGSSLTNTATVVGGGDPGCPGATHCSSEVITPVNAPSLELVKTASAATFVVGVPASYTLTVTNTGSAATTAAATVSDDVPAALTLGTMPADCAAAGQQVSCTIAAGFAPGASTSFTIPVTPTAAANGTSLTNTATVIGGGDPSCPGATHCTSTVVTPTNAPALELVKTASSTAFVVGVPASYTLTVTNVGSAATSAIATVSDDVPASLTIGTLPADCAVSAQHVSCEIAAGFAVGASTSFTIPVTPTAAASGSSLTNTATVIGGGDPSCPGAAHCTSTVVTPTDAPALTIVKTASATAFVVGVPASYTLTVTNTGSAATTTAATVGDDVPAALAIGTLPADCTASGQQVSCTIAAGFAAGASTSFTIPVTPTAAASGTSLTNTATVIGGGDPSCPAAAHCTSTVITPVDTASLTLVKTASAASFVVGVPASYTLTVTNTGSAATTAAATVTDNMPASLTIGALPGDCSAAAQQVSCTIAAGFAPGASTSFTIPVTPTAAASGTSLTNTATVIGGGDPSCPAAAHCTSTVITPTNAPALAIVKIGPATATAGQTVSYTITVTNNGSATATHALLDDTPPAGLGFVSAGAPCSAGFPCDLGDLAPGQSVVVSNVVFAIAANFSGQLVNVASVGSNETTRTSSSATTVVTPAAPPADATPVPLDARWALLAMMALLIGVGARRARTRR